jgi:hypothetical protein
MRRDVGAGPEQALRSFTVLCLIEPEKESVKIEKVVTIEKARKEYSRR